MIYQILIRPEFIETTFETIYGISMHCILRKRIQTLTTLLVKKNLRKSYFALRLDQFWFYQDVKYDYTSELTGIGDRSEVVIE